MSELHWADTHCWVSMLPDVHLGKRARVSYPDHLHCKIPEEINYLQRLPSQTENQDDGCHHWAQQLLQNKNLEEISPMKLSPSLGDSKQGIKSVREERRCHYTTFCLIHIFEYSLLCTGRAGRTGHGSHICVRYPASGLACNVYGPG